MTYRRITPDYSVSAQIMPADIEALKEAGFKTILCNRPDNETNVDHCSKAVQDAVEAAGLKFEALPFNQMTLTEETVAEQRRIITSAEAPVLAYCASGTRCSTIWALGEAQFGEMSAPDILKSAADAGYDLRGVGPILDRLCSAR
ncbi:MAG: TIGR01244 family sulfur transferase [Marinovum sp.]|nr:TIGR01244 family sulfur transferase [Marinovum sp.]